MKAAVLKRKGRLRIEEIPRFILEADQVTIRVRACGICGSDLRYFAGENPWAMHTLGRKVENEGNIILGHEFSGDVVEVGNPAYSSLLGKRVVAIPYNTCGICESCRSGRYNLCKSTRHIGHGAGWAKMDFYPGGMAEYCPIWRTHVCELPDSVPYDHAVLVDPLSVAIHAVKLSGLKPMDRVLVIGSGPVGLCLLQTGRFFGAAVVCSTDVHEVPLEIARKTGADGAYRVSDADALAHVMEHTFGEGFDVIFDTVGSAGSQRQALCMLAVSGTLVNLVANETRVSYRLLDLSGERRILSSANSRYNDYLLGIRMMERGEFRAAPIITHRFPLDETPKAFEMLLDKELSGAVKVVIEPD